MGKIVKEKALERIKQRIEEINQREDRSLEFLGFENDEWKNKQSRIIIHCLIHDTITTTKYKTFMQRNTDWGCSKCRVDAIIQSKSRCKTEEETINSIQNKIEELNNSGQNLEFLGFSTEFCTNASLLRLKIHCKNHDYIGEPPFQLFMKNGYMCPHCIGEYNAGLRRITNKEIYERLTSKFGDKYDFSKILNEEEIGRAARSITFICPKHGEFVRSIQALIYQNECPCPKCRQEQNMEDKTKEVIRNIKETLVRRKQSGYDYEFLGFVGEKYNGVYTKLRLRCKTHYYTWETTTYRNFVTDNSISACPECGQFVNEQKCFEIIQRAGFKVIRQYEIPYYDPVLTTDRKFKVDFYLPDQNLIIEYNGLQHYEVIDLYGGIEAYKERVRRDKMLEDMCKTSGGKYGLFSIPYVDNDRLEEVILEFLNNGNDITTKIIPKTYT